MSNQRVPKHLRKWRSKATKEGWDVYRMKSGHWRFVPPSGKGGVTVCSSPSDHRSIKNDRAQLRRGGLKVD